MSSPAVAHAGLVGFIGLGLLGQAMALRLAAQSFQIVGWNREPERCAPLAAAGAAIADSPRAVAERCSVVCLCVLDADAVEAVMFGAEGVAQAERRERVVIDFSTVDPDRTRTIVNQAAAVQVEWVDAPVSGGPAAAEEGNLTVMVGGRDEVVQRVDRLLHAVASNVAHVGKVGSGQAMKVVNQALVGSTFVMLAETLALVRSLGLPVEAVPSSLRGGFADSIALQRVWQRMASEDFDPPTGRAAQMLKDLKSVDRVRKAVPLDLPLLETATRQYESFVERGGAAEETLAIARLYGSQTRSSIQGGRPQSPREIAPPKEIAK